MPVNLPTLTILPVRDLILHEEPDCKRSSQLTKKLLQQGFLQNPPVVIPIASGKDAYVVLDGANRVTAFKDLGYPHIIVQVVEPGDPQLELSSWNHLVWGQPADEFLSNLSKVVSLSSKDESQTTLTSSHSDSCLIQFLFSDQRVFSTSLDVDPTSPFGRIQKVVGCYKNKLPFNRTDQTDLITFQELHEDLTALVIFPIFDIDRVLRLAVKGHCLPSGITRFKVPQRALHLNYPLQELSTSAKSLSIKQKELQHWIQSRLRNRNIRHYSEPTVLFDD
jgi:hypothetical protein